MVLGNFNSHAHVERDKRYFVWSEKLDISTHTLTWSVTRMASLIPCSSRISTHTLTWSVTEKMQEWRPAIEISTHTLTWSVTYDKRLLGVPSWISTHTLTWSVTLDVVYIWCLLNVMRTYFFI